MKKMHMPVVDWRYWAGITLASIFGTNMGDLYAHTLHLGIYVGTAALAVLAASIYFAERRSDRSTELFYWLVIIIIRTGATNIADYLAFRVHVPQLPLTVGLVLIVALAASLSAGPSATRTADLPMRTLSPTGPPYWIAMLGAGVFGTVVGDIVSHTFGEGYASVGLSTLLAIALLAGRNVAVSMIAAYWITVMIARTAGTAVGDWLAENRMLAIGLPLSTMMTGAMFIALLTVWRSGRSSTDRLVTDPLSASGDAYNDK